jgi:hypothetical protein
VDPHQALEVLDAYGRKQSARAAYLHPVIKHEDINAILNGVVSMRNCIYQRLSTREFREQVTLLELSVRS